MVDNLLCVQLTYPDRFLKATHYDLFNVWHQRHFGCMPSYLVYSFRANGFVRNHGLWVNLKDAGLVPNLENSINQLQELYQKNIWMRRPI